METALNNTTAVSPKPSSAYQVYVAKHDEDIEACLRLRYQVFAVEMQAHLGSSADIGMDRDRFDEHCHHLLVRDNKSGQVIATTRVLDMEGASQLGYYYSETEFDLSHILDNNKHFLEIGRTCIHPDFRRGATLAVLWQGLARLAIDLQADYLIGCASIPLSLGDEYVHACLDYLKSKSPAPSTMHVSPRVPLPAREQSAYNSMLIPDLIPELPPLLKGYLRMGCMIAGDPHWDAAFNVADVFILAETDKLNRRYTRHFIDRL